MKRWTGIGTFVVVVALIVGGAYLFTRPARERAVPTRPPAGAPAVGSCWQIDSATAQEALPWPGSPVDCAAPHTVEIFYLAQAGTDLLHRLDKAKRGNAKAENDQIKIITNLLYAQARRACVVQASLYLVGGWHSARVQVLASWIKPAENGFFACALAQVNGPGGQELLSRQGGLRGSLKDGGAAPLAIACVSRGGGDALAYVTCSEPHDGEFVGSYTITPLDAPFDDGAVRDAAQRGCGELGAKFLGLTGTAGRTDLSVGSVGPKTASDWLGSDQTFGCYVMTTQGKLAKTIHNLGAQPLPR
jgi:hypothetical protein